MKVVVGSTFLLSVSHVASLFPFSTIDRFLSRLLPPRGTSVLGRQVGQSAQQLGAQQRLRCHRSCERRGLIHAAMQISTWPAKHSMSLVFMQQCVAQPTADVRHDLLARGQCSTCSVGVFADQGSCVQAGRQVSKAQVQYSACVSFFSTVPCSCLLQCGRAVVAAPARISLFQQPKRHSGQHDYKKVYQDHTIFQIHCFREVVCNHFGQDGTQDGIERVFRWLVQWLPPEAVSHVHFLVHALCKEEQQTHTRCGTSTTLFLMSQSTEREQGLPEWGCFCHLCEPSFGSHSHSFLILPTLRSRGVANFLWRAGAGAVILRRVEGLDSLCGGEDRPVRLSGHSVNNHTKPIHSYKITCFSILSWKYLVKQCKVWSCIRTKFACSNCVQLGQDHILTFYCLATFPTVKDLPKVLLSTSHLARDLLLNLFWSSGWWRPKAQQPKERYLRANWKHGFAKETPLQPPKWSKRRFLTKHVKLLLKTANFEAENQDKVLKGKPI